MKTLQSLCFVAAAVMFCASASAINPPVWYVGASNDTATAFIDFGNAKSDGVTASAWILVTEGDVDKQVWTAINADPRKAQHDQMPQGQDKLALGMEITSAAVNSRVQVVPQLFQFDCKGDRYRYQANGFWVSWAAVAPGSFAAGEERALCAYGTPKAQTSPPAAPRPTRKPTSYGSATL